MRETFLSSLELTGDVLQELGFSYSEARSTLDRFREHDEQLLQESFQYQRDEKKLIEIAERSRRELESLFARDEARGAQERMRVARAPNPPGGDRRRSGHRPMPGHHLAAHLPGHPARCLPRRARRGAERRELAGGGVRSAARHPRGGQRGPGGLLHRRALPAGSTASYRGEVEAIYVHPSEQGQGHGTALVRAAMGWLAARRLTPVLVWALEANTSAHGFYQALGARRLDTRLLRIADALYPEVGFGWPERRAHCGLMGPCFTTSKSRPWIRDRERVSASEKRASGAPESHQLVPPPLSATIIP